MMGVACERVLTDNGSSFDPDSQLRSLLDALYLDVDQPYRLLEFLIDDGFHRVSEGAYIPRLRPGHAV